MILIKKVYSIKLNSIHKSYLKFPKFLNKIQNKTYIELLNILINFPVSIKLKFEKIYLSLIHSINFTYQNIFFLKTVITRNSILKRLQARAKGKSVIIKKRMSNLKITYCNKNLYTHLKCLLLLFIN
jgi:hypothetical protein